MNLLQIFSTCSMIFCSLAWMACSLMCFKTYMSLSRNFGSLSMENAELRVKVTMLESHSKGQQKTILNHNDRIDSLTTKVVKLLNTKELQHDQSN